MMLKRSSTLVYFDGIIVGVGCFTGKTAPAFHRAISDFPLALHLQLCSVSQLTRS